VTHGRKLFAGVAAVILGAGSLVGVAAQQRTNTTLGIEAQLRSLNATTEAQADKSCFPNAPVAESADQSTAVEKRRAGVNGTPGFVLSKTGTSNTCSGANIEFTGEDGIVLNRLGYDIRASSYFQAGAPRMVVILERGSTRIDFEPADMEVIKTFTDSEDVTWNRVRVKEGTADYERAWGEEIGALEIQFDETGKAVIDNIAISNATVKGLSAERTGDGRTKGRDEDRNRQ
jgi:hypothetical protein